MTLLVNHTAKRVFIASTRTSLKRTKLLDEEWCTVVNTVQRGN
jgi:hypothetical protein